VLALEDDDLMGPGGELMDGAKVCLHCLALRKVTMLNMTCQISWLEMYSNTQQLHGIHTQHLKNEWQCHQHLGENGCPGACYVIPSDNHIGLNIRCLAAWAATMVCHLAYVHGFCLAFIIYSIGRRRSHKI
jgi:hypothetical protein